MADGQLVIIPQGRELLLSTAVFQSPPLAFLLTMDSMGHSLVHSVKPHEKTSCGDANPVDLLYSAPILISLTGA